MSMGTHVVGFRPPDKTWKKMKAVWDACTAAGTEIPNEVVKFFNHEDPDESGVVVEIMETPACRRWEDDMREGYEIDISKLPEGLMIIRFYNSW